jgi:uncharacterized protein with PIN domain
MTEDSSSYQDSYKNTFVTSFFNIYEEDYDNQKTMPWRLERFREIAKIGIPICVYVCPSLNSSIEQISKEFPNVKIMQVIPIDELWIAKECRKVEYSLPSARNDGKDIDRYLMVINSKTEFMCHAIEKNPWKSSHFAWIDFNISHVFFQKESTLEYLKLIAQCHFNPSCFVIPGCWNKFDNVFIAHITETIFWRFCGGFFIGDADSIRNFDRLYKEHFPVFIKNSRKLIWEVNFWAWLESNSEWNPTWYLADHNDTILTNMSAHFFTPSLVNIGSNNYLYEYPKIHQRHPSSASYVYHNGKHFLNTRYVNYWFYLDGGYLFYDGFNIIRTTNVCSELIPTTASGQWPLIPIDFNTMEETIDLEKHDFYSRGIEDLRLYSIGGKVKYIATTVGYYHTTGNRMVVGEYDIENRCYNDSHLIEPPTDTFCEKNWIPIVKTLDNGMQEELFIYRWQPFEIGKIVENENGKHQLEIVITHDNTRIAPFFHKIRGSAPLVEYNGHLVGVVHFSEEKKPRNYYHMMVMLDKDTYIPLKYSRPFYFNNIGIEFCIGFSINENKYWFWISQFDRDPMLVSIDVNKIDINCNFM